MEERKRRRRITFRAKYGVSFKKKGKNYGIFRADRYDTRKENMYFPALLTRKKAKELVKELNQTGGHLKI